MRALLYLAILLVFGAGFASCMNAVTGTKSLSDYMIEQAQKPVK